jgi:hypothetical protein
MLSSAIHQVLVQEHVADTRRRRQRHESVVRGRLRGSGVTARAFRATPHRWHRRFAV